MQKSVYTKEYRLLLDRLCQARLDSGLSQQQLVERLPLHAFQNESSKMESERRSHKLQRYISRCESGERRLDVLECYYFCTALGIDFVELMQSLAEQWDTLGANNLNAIGMGK